MTVAQVIAAGDNVICKCEKVTEAEVIAACHRALPIDSTQAIRKRTRAGMGNCQGKGARLTFHSNNMLRILRFKALIFNFVWQEPPVTAMTASVALLL
jgi:hypothetical protein